MSFVSHTDSDVKKMLQAIGVSSVDDLFDEIPQDLQIDTLNKVPSSTIEPDLVAEMNEVLSQDAVKNNFIGAGSYEHYSPAVIWDLTFRGEYLTAYTPYQPEVSQGTLQVIYEYQTMMTELMAMDVSNASLYDGATSLAESVLMSIRVQGKKAPRRILLSGALHPSYIEVVKTWVQPQGIEVIVTDVDKSSGLTDFETVSENDFAAIVLAQPNFYGCYEDVHRWTNWAHDKKMLVIAVVNPLLTSVLSPPGSWGEAGADIACGEGQSLGLPLASGGPYYGFMACKEDFVRHLPGRIVGKSKDINDNDAYVLTLQAREQHIRRSKATSNICTNQGLMVTASTIYMSLMGANGLATIAKKSIANANTLKQMLMNAGVPIKYSNTQTAHEFVVGPIPNLKNKIKEAAKSRTTLGFELTGYGLEDCLLTCVTEVKTQQQLEHYVNLMRES